MARIHNNVESLTFNDELSERNTERSLIRYPLTTNRYMILSKFCLIVLMWYIIKGRPESDRIGGNTGSTANCVLSDICLIETADGDGTLNNVSMKDGCL